jgi:hypothetical protein
VFFANEFACLQSDTNTQHLNENANKQQIMKKMKAIPAFLTLLASLIQHKYYSSNVNDNNDYCFLLIK